MNMYRNFGIILKLIADHFENNFKIIMNKVMNASLIFINEQNYEMDQTFFMNKNMK